jgi:hypothetical protein
MAIATRVRMMKALGAENRWESGRIMSDSKSVVKNSLRTN